MHQTFMIKEDPINISKAMKLRQAVRNAEQELSYYRRVESEKEQEALVELKNAKEALSDELSKKLIPALDKVQRLSRERTISPDDIFSSLERLCNELNISKKAMENLSVWVDCNAQDFPKAYKYTPMSTQFFARFKSGSWRVTCIKRCACERAGHKYTVDHTEESKQAILDRFTSF